MNDQLVNHAVLRQPIPRSLVQRWLRSVLFPNVRVDIGEFAVSEVGPIVQTVGDSIGVIKIVSHIEAAKYHLRLQAERPGLKEIIILVRAIAAHSQAIDLLARQPLKNRRPGFVSLGAVAIGVGIAQGYDFRRLRYLVVAKTP